MWKTSDFVEAKKTFRCQNNQIKSESFCCFIWLDKTVRTFLWSRKNNTIDLWHCHSTEKHTHFTFCNDTDNLQSWMQFSDLREYPEKCHKVFHVLVWSLRRVWDNIYLKKSSLWSKRILSRPGEKSAANETFSATQQTRGTDRTNACVWCYGTF